MHGKLCLHVCICLLLNSCSKKTSDTQVPPVEVPKPLNIVSFSLNNLPAQNTYYNITVDPNVIVNFDRPIDKASLSSGFTFKTQSGVAIRYNTSYINDSSVSVSPEGVLNHLNKYIVTISSSVKSTKGGNLKTPKDFSFITAIDSTDKFPRISDWDLLELVERQTFKYFYDFGHPVSGMARERNSSGDVVTTGGTGFGVMCLVVGASNQFITKQESLARVQKIVTFLKTKCTTYHGAFSHWINGSTGATIPFSEDDDGADLVETAFLMQGLLTARQYFMANTSEEIQLRSDINSLWNDVEWDWFRRGNENVLYWHWSPNKEWKMNVPVRGWNEAMIVYVLAASSTTHPISKEVYDRGWADSYGIKNGMTYYGEQLILGPPLGGPLFFAHYSFLGLNPTTLNDTYANYFAQNLAHSRINRSYCIDNPSGFFGYSGKCWGLTASDDPSGYRVHEPTNDNGTISPTAAIASLPYTPRESMDAIAFFYYQLGDKLWKQYGFVDAFNLQQLWFADSHLAIDQGPIVIMIENYRSNLLWDVFMSAPELKTGLKKLQIL